MRCIFCAQTSEGSKSREHILPESLGNIEHTLPPGVVCDSCNNYFAVKIEGPLLASSHFTSQRSRQNIPNKRGRLPLVRGVFPAGQMAIGFQRSEDGLRVRPWRESDTNRLLQTLQSELRGRFYVPVPGPPDEHLMARFLAKVGVEILAFRLISHNFDTDLLLDETGIEEIRRFARRGDGPSQWPIHQRRIYDEDAVFGQEHYQVLHEFDILRTAQDEWYAIVCIFGEEFAINLGGPSIQGYIDYLADNGGVSPLYKPQELEDHLRSAGIQQQVSPKFPV